MCQSIQDSANIKERMDYSLLVKIPSFNQQLLYNLLWTSFSPLYLQRQDFSLNNRYLSAAILYIEYTHETNLVRRPVCDALKGHFLYFYIENYFHQVLLEKMASFFVEIPLNIKIYSIPFSPFVCHWSFLFFFLKKVKYFCTYI